MEELEKKLNYTFRDRGLLSEALSHSSYANEHRSAHLRSNERLEFLGDSVLGFVTAEFLFAQHPDLPEGDLTRIRAALVCEQSLYEVARKLDLGRYLKLGRGEEGGGGRSGRPSWQMPRRRCSPRCIWTAASVRLPTSSTAACWTRKRKRPWRSGAGTTRPRCRNWCSGRHQEL